MIEQQRQNTTLQWILGTPRLRAAFWLLGGVTRLLITRRERKNELGQNGHRPEPMTSERRDASAPDDAASTEGQEQQ
ncbi:hypothetical protein DEI81_02455 [Curtobacterium sp. MCBD17_013]|uniref:hypothetical protein n=1 Tax=Curtobacterium sp. MCBD17_013 TaxID=2175668 RepID=UPI000DA72522|nr:hypothetical protein [Curtobacterium sp. MCBD17_013]PZF66477.1 hypothetical protein DEI81_02455 [Curtobacterium sp. MCBD17_013]